MSQQSPIYKYAKKKGITEHDEHDVLLDILKAGRAGRTIDNLKKSVKQFAKDLHKILPSLERKGVIINKGNKYIGIFASVTAGTIEEFKIELLPTSDESSGMSTTHLHSVDALIEELLDPDADNLKIHLYDDDMNYGTNELMKDLKKELPGGFDMTPSGNILKIKRKFAGPTQKDGSKNKVFKDPVKREYEKLMKQRQGKPSLKVLKSTIDDSILYRAMAKVLED